MMLIIGYSVALNVDKGSSSTNPNYAMYTNQQAAIPHNTGYNVNGSGHMNLTNFASQLNVAQYSTAGYSLTNNNNHQEAGVSSNWSSANIAYPLGTEIGYSGVHNNNQIGGSSSNFICTNMVVPQTEVPQNTAECSAMYSNHEQDGTTTAWNSAVDQTELDAGLHELITDPFFWDKGVQ
ncbi:uncharacterized protein LOC106865825 isoform X2 [Brachypodium distachyon]|uniref:uncharacterized protein LOC106865825 isoform X2 n=1 Tax=Brachypodium distachyon TaxID=15368 RepID=UPI000D0D23AE|nr:uncharacterized protein LOC106865825 isoform X2 [Brachypodium distachyon]|eukprot:XP_024313775.1 uncharacterized protein LOC106865825 isoform X2 [Brachypodium distachyon]